MVTSRWERSENLWGEKVLMSVAEGNVSLTTDLPTYQLLFTIKVIGALAHDFTHLHSRPPRDEIMFAHSSWFPARSELVGRY
jgi:hypothetical protein